MKILLIGGLGYIGSYLYHYLKSKMIEVNICDDLRRGNPLDLPCSYPYDYHGLTSKEFGNYDAVLWFAGHSSVSTAMADPMGAINNNMIHLIELLKKLPNENIKFIYASTASLYSGEDGYANESARVVPYENIYDISKFSFDYLSKNYHSNLFGLRMGTLAGFSSNIRTELIFNQMCLSAYFNKQVKVANKTKFRSILFLSDLAEIINILLKDNQADPGFYNAGSFSYSIDELSTIISSFFDAKIIALPDTNTYSFKIDTSKIASLGFKKTLTFDMQIRNFSEEIKINEKKLKPWIIQV